MGMDERSDTDKMDEVMLPGFRFHPTDEELVGFYLKRKIQQRPLSIELIKQLDIYKYDPWDLPKLTTGEKEWYFYCPRDRKYRNSARPNRVTGAGFWKATGTDRPIYSSEGSKCIGLKKSLVFYKGRAAKGIKTDWMMHEFRLPSLIDSAPKRFMDKSIPPNDSWAICRIFKKTNSTAQRALSHSWVSAAPETTSPSPIFATTHDSTQLNQPNMSSNTTSTIQFCSNNIDTQQSSTPSISPLDFASYKPIYAMATKPSPLLPILAGDFMFSPPETTSAAAKCTADVSSMLQNMSSSMFGDFREANESIHFHGLLSQEQQCNNNVLSSVNFAHEMQGNGPNLTQIDEQWESAASRSLGFPFSLPLNMYDAWKPNFL